PRRTVVGPIGVSVQKPVTPSQRAFWACAATAESETPASSVARRKRACDRPDPCLIGPATPNSPFASSGGKTATPRTHPARPSLASPLCPSAPPHKLRREIVGYIPNIRQRAVAAI